MKRAYKISEICKGDILLIYYDYASILILGIADKVTETNIRGKMMWHSFGDIKDISRFLFTIKDNERDTKVFKLTDDEIIEHIVKLLI